MDAGKLDKRIVIEVPVSDENAYGGTPRSYATYRECWAAVEPLSGAELERAGQLHALATHAVTIRWCAGIKESMRISFGARYLEIKLVVNPEERGAFLELLCTEERDG